LEAAEISEHAFVWALHEAGLQPGVDAIELRAGMLAYEP
jgi:hypothetical protein